MAVRYVSGIENHVARCDAVYTHFNKRRPLKKIEDTLNFEQTKPQLSVPIAPFDLVVAALTTDDPKGRHTKSAPVGRGTRPLRHRVQSATIYTPFGGRSSKRPRTTNDVIYQLERNDSSTTEGGSPVLLTKLVWKDGKYQPDALLQGQTLDNGHIDWSPVGKPDNEEDVPSPDKKDMDIGRRMTSAMVDPDDGSQISYRRQARKSARSSKKRLELDVDTGDDTEILGSNTLSEVEKDRSKAQQKLTPLCIAQAEEQSKIIRTLKHIVPEKEIDVSTTRPVVYNILGPAKAYQNHEHINDGYKVRAILKTRKALDGTPRPVTALSICRDRDVIPTYDMAYEELLMSQAPGRLASKPPVSPVPSPNNDTEEAKDVFDLSEQKDAPTHITKRAKTPVLHITRQCSMPSYAVLPASDDKDGDSKTPVICDRSIASGIHREWRQLKPPLYPPSYKQGYKTPATITSHGIEGSKEFVKFTLPMSHIMSSTQSKEKPKSAPARMNPRKPSANYVKYASSRPHTSIINEQTDESDITEAKLVSKNISLTQRFTPAQKTRSRNKLVSSPPTNSRKPTHSEPHQTESVVTKSPRQHYLSQRTDITQQEVGEAMNTINIPTAGDELVSLMSSANLLSDRSLGDADTSDDGSEFVPLVKSSPRTAIKTMKEQIHNDLEQTKADMQNFIDGIDEKRRNKKPQLDLSDDELENHLLFAKINMNNNTGLPAVETLDADSEDALRIAQSSPLPIDQERPHDNTLESYHGSMRSSMEDILAEQSANFTGDELQSIHRDSAEDV